MRISDWSSDVCSSDLFALLIGVWKIGQAVSVGLMFVCLSLLDFNLAPGAVNAASASLQISLLFVLFPACLKFAAAATILRYPLTASRERTSVVSGKSDSVRVDLGGGSIIKKKK